MPISTSDLLQAMRPFLTLQAFETVQAAFTRFFAKETAAHRGQATEEYVSLMFYEGPRVPERITNWSNILDLSFLGLRLAGEAGFASVDHQSAWRRDYSESAFLTGG